MKCKSLQCRREASDKQDFCSTCQCIEVLWGSPNTQASLVTPIPANSLAEKYSQYYKPVGALTKVDVYAVHHLFDIQDSSGAIQHASKKLLLSGVRTGGKTKRKDIQEARDTLDRWLQLNPEII